MANWELHFRNFDNQEQWFGAYHAGCGGAPWHTGRPRCWDCTIINNPGGGENSVYVPSNWVVNFGAWFQVLVQGLEEAVNIGLFIAEDGEDADEVIQGAFDVEKDVVDALMEQYQLNNEDLQTLLSENFNAACAAIGQNPQTVINYAQQMGFGSSGWGLITAGDYQANVYNDNETNGGYGWTILRAPPSGSVSHIANAAFIQNGHLIYMWDSNNLNGFWNPF